MKWDQPKCIENICVMYLHMKIKLESSTCISICLEQKSKIQLCVMCLTLFYVRTKHAKGKSQSVVTDGHDDYVFDFSNNNYTSIRGCSAGREERNYILPNSNPKTRACSY